MLFNKSSYWQIHNSSSSALNLEQIQRAIDLVMGTYVIDDNGDLQIYYGVKIPEFFITDFFQDDET